MADEIKQLVKLSVVNGGMVASHKPGETSIDQTNQLMHNPVVTVGFAAEEDFDTGDVGAANQGLIQFTNLDATNYVTWGPKDTTMKAIGRLMPGESAQFRLEPSVVLRWQANTADVKVQVTLLGT